MNDVSLKSTLVACFMSKAAKVVATLMIVIGLASVAQPAAAQQVIGFQPGVGQICNGPLGVAPCAVIQDWMARQGIPQPQFGGLPLPPAVGDVNLPGAGLLPQDGQIVAEIAQTCNGQPICIAAAWGSVEVQRCRNGFGNEGGCFGPNGEIMKVINQALPQNLHPDVIINNGQHDLQHGMGPNNEIRKFFHF